MKITEADTDDLTLRVKDGLTAGQLLWQKGLRSEGLFYFYVLDDTPPEDSSPLVFPELDQQLQVRIFLVSLLSFLVS